MRGGGREKKSKSEKKFWKEGNNVQRIREQVSEIAVGTNGEVLEGNDVLKRRRGRVL